LASLLSGKSLESLPLDVKFWGIKMYKIRFRLGRWRRLSTESAGDGENGETAVAYRSSECDHGAAIYF